MSTRIIPAAELQVGDHIIASAQARAQGIIPSHGYVGTKTGAITRINHWPASYTGNTSATVEYWVQTDPNVTARVHISAQAELAVESA